MLFSFFTQRGFFNAPLYSFTLSVIALFFIVLPLLSIFSILYGIGKKIEKYDGTIYGIAILFTAGFLTALHRWSFTNIVWALPLLLPSLKYLFEGELKKASKVVSLFITLSAIVFSISFYTLSSPERLVSICGKAGCVRTFPSEYSIGVDRAVSFLETNSKDGETLFCSGFNGFINFLTQMKNPTPFNEFVDYNTKEQLEQLKKSIAEKEVDWILIPSDKKESNLKIENFVKEGYEKIFENNFCKIYKKKSDT